MRIPKSQSRDKYIMSQEYQRIGNMINTLCHENTKELVSHMINALCHENTKEVVT